MHSRQPEELADRREFLYTAGVSLGGWTATSPAADAPLPAGVRAVWDVDKAFRESTTTRERVCLNGLWRWQPATDNGAAVPADGWGYFKVPGFWPGTTNYIQEDCQTLYSHPGWTDSDARRTVTAWYQREFSVPPSWAGRRVLLSAEYVHSLADVFVDGKQAGEIRFPAGEVDLTAVCRPGSKHVLSLRVTALPLQAVLLSFADTNAARQVKGTVERRGLCGDVFLTGLPAVERVSDVQIEPSVRRGELTLRVAVQGLAAGMSYVLHIDIREDGRSVRAFSSPAFQADDLKAGRVHVTEKWRPEKLWDLHTPAHQLDALVSLTRADGTHLDDFFPARFGFREFWIDGRDFYLNGSRIHLSAVPLDNAQLGARTATYAATRETLRRFQSFGINLVYTHNYGCEPGSHVSFAEVLRAADDAGVLVAFSQPHFSHYDWKAPDADRANGFARHAAFFVRAAQNHPAVVAYAMSHNATGYDEDMNPDLIDGLSDPREPWGRNNARLALRAEAIVRTLDPGRIIYHHASGNLGALHTMNCYLNFVPVQEVSDWFEHWATAGVKPVFPCEYGVPFSWDWALYRGWYRGQRAFGSAAVPWELCLAEWNAQFLGDRAYHISDAEKRDLRWEAGQFRAGRLWHRWDYPTPIGSAAFDDRQEVFARYLTDNWRAHRTWGISANSPWEYAIFWKRQGGTSRRRVALSVDWEHLQKPGLSPDYVPPREGWFSVDGAEAEWVPGPAAQALFRNNRPLLAYVAGKPGGVTGKDHNFRPGDVVEKQLVVINESRKTATGSCSWSLGLPTPVTGSREITLPTGCQERIPLRFDLPASLPVGRYNLSATVRFGTGEIQNDSFAVHVLDAGLRVGPGRRPGPTRTARPFRPRGRDSEGSCGGGRKVPARGSDRRPVAIRRARHRQAGADGRRPGAGR